MEKINDTQNAAIYDVASKEHDKLCEMYNKKKEIMEKHLIELTQFDREIENQEQKVTELCEGRLKLIKDPKSKRLIMDLRD